MMKFLLIMLLIYVSLSNVNADCKYACNGQPPEDHICTGEETFALCSDDKKSFSCPAQYFCVDNKNICERNAVPTCRSECGLCNRDTGIACINETAYAFCFGGNEPHFDITVTCDKRMFCNSKEKSFCTKDKKPSCDDSNIIIPSTPSTPTTTPAGIELLCRKIQQGGKFTP